VGYSFVKQTTKKWKLNLNMEVKLI